MPDGKVLERQVLFEDLKYVGQIRISPLGMSAKSLRVLCHNWRRIIFSCYLFCRLIVDWIDIWKRWQTSGRGNDAWRWCQPQPKWPRKMGWCRPRRAVSTVHHRRRPIQRCQEEVKLHLILALTGWFDGLLTSVICRSSHVYTCRFMHAMDMLFNVRQPGAKGVSSLIMTAFTCNVSGHDASC